MTSGPHQPDRPQPLALTLVGTVESGVEHGSVVLRTDAGEVWQVGMGCAHLVGCRVRLVGRPRHGILTTAMQGVPLSVDDVEVLAGQPRDTGGVPGAPPRGQ